MTYKENTPTFNINRKVVNFKDFSANPNAEKEELKKMNKQNQLNSFHLKTNNFYLHISLSQILLETPQKDWKP